MRLSKKVPISANEANASLQKNQIKQKKNSDVDPSLVTTLKYEMCGAKQGKQPTKAQNALVTMRTL